MFEEKADLTLDENDMTKYEPDYFDYLLLIYVDDLQEIINIYKNGDELSKKALLYCYEEAQDIGHLCKTYYFNGTPIEKLFYHCFRAICDMENINLWLLPQVEIDVNKKHYIVDFMVGGKDIKNQDKYIIECDGHEFHSTKEQIANDNQRQRDLENSGYIFIRFSGSEIYKKPEKCVYEALKRIHNEETK